MPRTLITGRYQARARAATITGGETIGGAPIRAEL